MECKDCRRWLSDNSNPSAAVIAHLEACPACRMIVEREVTGEPLPLSGLPLLELPSSRRVAPLVPSEERSVRDGEGFGKTTGWRLWFETDFRNWLPSLGAALLLLGLGVMLASPWMKPGLDGRRTEGIDLAALKNLAASAARNAGGELPEPVFGHYDGDDEPIAFAEPESESIEFLSEPVKTMSFGTEERFPTFFDLNLEKEESFNG